jgi:uncharacterized protein with PIN domain
MRTSKKKTNDPFEELDEFDLIDIELEEDEPSYTSCPRCGSEYWSQLHTTKLGEPAFCNECKSYESH